MPLHAYLWWQQTVFMRNKRHLFFILAAGSLLLTRVLPHPPNFTATSASILAITVLSPGLAGFLFLLASYWLSDLYLNNFIYSNGQTFTYFTDGFYWIAGFLLVQFLINKIFYAKNFRPLDILPAAFVNSTLFFLSSNLIVWFNNPRFAQDISGLIKSYVDAIPFYTNDLFASLCYSSIFFGIYWLINPELRWKTKPSQP
jgi:hypothetical protein